MSGDLYSFTRRGFVMGAASGLGSTAAAAQAVMDHLPGRIAPWLGPWDTPAVVRKVYLADRTHNWPSRSLNLEQELRDLDANISLVETRFPHRIRFEGGEVFYSDQAEKLKAWAPSTENADGILAVIATSGIGNLLQAVLALDKPTLVYERPYSGHEWAVTSIARQLGKKVDLVASSDFHELDPFVDAFYALHHLRNSKLLVAGRQRRDPGQPSGRPATPAEQQFGNEAYAKKFGTTFAYPSYAEIRSFYDANEAEGNKLADEYIKSAARLVEPPREQVVKAIRLHLAIVELMRAEKANAITFGCIGAPVSGDLPAYPCISFSLLNDVGLYGCCEGDVPCAMTNILVTGFSGKPGFVTDPIFDTSHDEVIHAHCSSPTAMEGVGRRPFPFSIRSYPYSGETRAAAIQVHFGGTGPVTVAKFTGPQNMLVSTGEVLGNVEIDRGCRSKLRTRVKDSHKLLQNWAMATAVPEQRPPALLSTLAWATQEQLHRVAFYGDHVAMLERIGRLAGFRVIRED